MRSGGAGTVVAREPPPTSRSHSPGHKVTKGWGSPPSKPPIEAHQEPFNPKQGPSSSWL